MNIIFCLDDYSQGSPVDPPPKPTESLLTIITNPAFWQVQQLAFDSHAYFTTLKTTNMGRSVVYTPVITSTQEVLCGNLPFSLSLTSKAGVVCVAGQQTKGKGTVCTYRMLYMYVHTICAYTCTLYKCHLLHKC